MTCKCTIKHLRSDCISPDWGKGHKMGGGMRCLVWGVYCLGLAISLFCLGLANPGGIRHLGGGSQICQIPGFGSKMGFWVKNGVLGGGIAKKGSKLPFGGGGYAKKGEVLNII